MKTSPRDFLWVLLWLRAAAVIAEAVTVAVVSQDLHVDMPLGSMALVIAVLAAIGLFTALRLRSRWPVTEVEAALQLLVDVAALTALLYMSGGYTNPFATLYLIPVTLAAVMLSRPYAAAIAFGCLAAYGFLMFYCIDLVYEQLDAAGIYRLHCLGAGVNFAISTFLLSIVLTSMATHIRRRDRELARLREADMRREHLTAIGVMAAGAAHELSTPLSTMLITVAELKTGEFRKAQQTRAFAILDRQIHLCKAKLDHLLHAAGQARSPGRRPLLLRELVENALDTWHLIRPGVELAMDWDCVAEPMVDADEGLSQALISLLDNAADASFSRGSARVVLTVRHDPAAVCIHIDDEGPGLPHQAEAQVGKVIFSSKSQGYGLGLAISHANLDRLGGEIVLSRRKEGGMRATISMPLLQPDYAHG